MSLELKTNGSTIYPEIITLGDYQSGSYRILHQTCSNQLEEEARQNLSQHFVLLGRENRLPLLLSALVKTHVQVAKLCGYQSGHEIGGGSLEIDPTKQTISVFGKGQFFLGFNQEAVLQILKGYGDLQDWNIEFPEDGIE